MGKRGRPPKKIFDEICPDADQTRKPPNSFRIRPNHSLNADKRLKTDDERLPNLNLINVVGNSSVKSFLTVENFLKIPMQYRRQLLKLLPECDRTTDESGKPKLASNALNNEYFTHACLDFKDRLLSGYLTPDGNAKDTKLNKSTVDKLDPWKLKHFEAYFGEKLKNVNDDVLPPKRPSFRKASVVDSVEKPLKLVEASQPKQLQRRGKGRPRKIIPEAIVAEEPANSAEIEKPLPKLYINFKTKTLSFFVDGQSSVREWEESSRSTSQSPKPSEFEQDQKFDLPQLLRTPFLSTSAQQDIDNKFAELTEGLETSPSDGQTPEPIEPCDEEIEDDVKQSIENMVNQLPSPESRTFASESPPRALPVVSPKKEGEEILAKLEMEAENVDYTIERPGSVPVTRSQAVSRKMSS